MATETLKLYELTSAHRQLMDDIAESGGEITPEQEQTLDALEVSLTGKVDTICRMRAELEATAAGIACEQERLINRICQLRGTSLRLKDYMQSCLERSGRERVDTDLFTVRLQASPASARWTRLPEDIPQDFRRVVPERVEFNAREALRLHREGQPLPEGIEVTRSRHLVIK